MKIYKLTDDSNDYDCNDITIGYFSSYEKAQEAKKNVEEYCKVVKKFEEAAHKIHEKFMVFIETYPVKFPPKPALVKKHDGQHMRHLSTLHQTCLGEGNPEMAASYLGEYQEKCRFNESVNEQNRHIQEKHNNECGKWSRTRDEAFEATLSEIELKIQNSEIGRKYTLPLEIIEIEVDEYEPMNISELKELL